MNADAGRRTFVRQMAIGLPVFAGAAVAPAMARGGVPAVGIPAPDARLEGVVGRMAALHNEMQRRLPTPGDAATLAAELRALVAHRRASHRDAQIATASRALIDRHGTSRLSALQPDLRFLTAGLVHYGIQREPVLLAAPPIAVRASALDEIARRGADVYYDDLMMAVASLLGSATSDCQLLQEALTLMETMASVMCLLAPFIPALIPECFAASVVLAAMQLIALLVGC